MKRKPPDRSHPDARIGAAALTVPRLAPLSALTLSALKLSALPLSAILVLAGTALGGCTMTNYYSQALRGETSLLLAARPAEEWIADPQTPAGLRSQLELAQRIRTFASQALALPENRSYRRYADLHRDSAVWNVFATGEFSLTLHSWCYPVFGCASYRGYFDQADAQAYAAQLAGEGYDTNVAPIPAFSTLGWFSDPLLNTFINWPEPELARLIFHELAHQVLYVKGDTRFNESFATAVEQEGVSRWIAQRGDAALRDQYEQLRNRRADLVALVDQARRRLEAAYQAAAGTQALRSQKQAIFAQLQADFRQVREQRWNGYAGYDAFFQAPWNNARVAALAAYQDEVPAFAALLSREHGELPRFYLEAKRLGALDPPERSAALRALAGGTSVRTNPQ